MIEHKIQGMYTLKKYNASTGELVQEIGPFCNKITNIGLNAIGGRTSSATVSGYVGTGTLPAQFTDTSMGVFKATGTFQAQSQTNGGAPTYWSQVSTTFRFAAGQINGNITEVGVGTTSTGADNLWSRELIVDSSGNPITLTVLANEILDVVYTLRHYPDLNDFTGTFNLTTNTGTVTHTYTGRYSSITGNQVNMGLTRLGGPITSCVYGASTVLGPVTGFLTGFTGTFGNPTQEYLTYVNNSLQFDTRNNFALTPNPVDGLLAGIELRVSGFLQARYQILFSPRLPKTAENTMSLTFRHSWGRYSGPTV